MTDIDTVVVIPALNVAHTLPRQLAALDAQTDLGFRVVVSDNGSTDETRAVAEGWRPRFQGIEVVDASQRRGVASARNVAIAATTEPFILICDGDDRVHPGWVAAMRAALQEADGVTGPLHLYLNGQPTEIWNETALPVSMSFREYLPGCSIGMRRTAFDLVGGFDPDLVLGQEDVDFGWRLVGAGATLAHARGAAIDYFQRATARQFIRQQYRYGRAHVALYAKHPDSVPPARLRTSVRWFWEWAKQYRPGKGLRALGGPAFQVGRLRESLRRRISAPL